MRALTTICVLLTYSSVLAQDQTITSIPLVGDETSLLRVQADPQQFLDKPIILAGLVKIDDFYIWGYGEAADTHYSFEFQPLTKDAKATEEDCQVYGQRDLTEPLSAAIIKRQERGLKNHIVRVKVALLSQRANDSDLGSTWNQMELADWQFLSDDGQKWEPWTHDKKNADDAAQQARAVARKAAENKAKKELAAERENAKWRVWTDSTGKHKFEAKYSGMVGGKVRLTNQKGRTVELTLDKLSEDDRKWIESRSK